ncbi:hypothetical protein BDF20DRAFT_821193, partial [Mycotypha africana]|uniref:uncharacterized protein n=1 Tax=Mycotypha africana TaxID=64632 RepID=UPI0023017787
ILWLPMSFIERSRCLLWRLGWLPNDYSAHCLFHPPYALSLKPTPLDDYKCTAACNFRQLSVTF